MERLTARDWLVDFIQDEYIVDGYPDLIPEELLLVDWKRAGTYDVGKRDAAWIDHDRMQDILIDHIGFDAERALRLVDPAVHNIARRILALPMLTAGFCSGHLDKHGRIDRKQYTYGFSVVFKDRAFGRTFINEMVETVAQPPFKMDVDGTATRQYGVAHRWLSVETCLELRLPISFSVRTDRRRKTTQLVDAWQRIAAVLNLFDGEGGFDQPLEAFREKVPVTIGTAKIALFRDVLTELFPDKTF